MYLILAVDREQPHGGNGVWKETVSYKPILFTSTARIVKEFMGEDGRKAMGYKVYELKDITDAVD